MKNKGSFVQLKVRVEDKEVTTFIYGGEKVGCIIVCIELVCFNYFILPVTVTGVQILSMVNIDRTRGFGDLCG